MGRLDYNAALNRIAASADRLRDALRLPWSRESEQAVARLALTVESADSPANMVGLFGGASSGKSTIFDNLLDGRLASRITARGHATLGPILAVHESHRAQLDALSATGRFLSGFRREEVGLEDNVTGAVETLSVVYHDVSALRDVFLFDLPDFTSAAAADEGDVALSLAAWFDRIIIVLDHERWFDRQSISTLRTHSTRFDQQRWAVFNQTEDRAVTEAERTALSQQASRLAAVGSTQLEFRRGRGLCRFPPQTFDDVVAFAVAPPPDRRAAIGRVVARAAQEVLNQNKERSARLRELRRQTDAVLDRTVPNQRACMIALMTHEERRQTEWMSRVLRIQETRQWFSDQTRRLTAAIRQVPVLGTILVPRGATSQPTNGEATDRTHIGTTFARRVTDRHRHELDRLVQACLFWDEVRRWTGLEPSALPRSNGNNDDALADAVRTFDQAMQNWNRRVETECDGLNPHTKGAIGAGTIALAVVLIAVPGPITALTAVAAKGAIAGALTQLLTAAGAGALVGRPVARLTSMIQERLIGATEYQAVQSAVSVFRHELSDACAQLNDFAITQAAELVLPDGDPLIEALERICDGTSEAQP